jgi:hypothetical protein
MKSAERAAARSDLQGFERRADFARIDFEKAH